MRALNYALCVIGMASVLTACKKKPSSAETAASATTTQAAKPETPKTQATPASTALNVESEQPKTKVDGIATPEDYEEEATNRISSDNVQHEVDQLDKEISSNQ